jgi:hypothetical protein
VELRVAMVLVVAGCAPVNGVAPVSRAAAVAVEAPVPETVTSAFASVLPAEAPSPEPEPPSPLPPPSVVIPEVEPVVPHQPAPRYAKLFEAYKRYHYVVVDDVDPHAEDGGRIVTRSKVVCNVTEVRSYEAAMGVELDCAGEDAPDEGDSGISSSFVFVSAPGGLWMPSVLPLEKNDVGTVIIDPPMLADVPQPRTRKLERPGSTEDRPDVCTQRVSVSPRSTCFEERCAVTDGYGDTRSHLCISQRGVESFTTATIGGPRRVSWQLQRVQELPEPSCGG